MKIAFKNNTVNQITGPKFGTLTERLTGDLTPTLERKLPPTIDQQREYSIKINKSDFTVKFMSSVVRAEQVKHMRVRQSKAGPNGKPKVDLNMLARAEEKYAFGKIEKLVRNDGFNKFNEVKVTKETKKDHKDNKTNAVFKAVNGDSWEYTKHLKPIKQLGRLHSVAPVNKDVLDATNNLLRQVMLFKGIGFADIERDVRLAGKPVAYIMNTFVSINTGNKDANGGDIMRGFIVHKVVVKKTFREIENIMGEQQEVCKVFFDGKCCRNLTFWLKSFDFKP